MAFPSEPLEIFFRGRPLYLLPGRPKSENNTFGDLYPVVALEHSGMSFEDGQRIISAFVNSVAWSRRQAINTAQFGGGGHLHGLGGPDAKAIVDDHFELNYVPDPADDRARLALAFYREGLNLNSVAYQCLSFFKILNISLPNSKAQKDWIDANLTAARQRDPHSTHDWEKNAGFDPTKETAGNYLYVSNRCAVAHAFNDPLINPDDPDDRRRLVNDLPMVRALAEHFIEQEFGVKSTSTVWKEHLYELEGFSSIWGAAMIGRVKAGEEVPVDQFSILPKLSVTMTFQPTLSSFALMNADVIDCADGKVNLHLTSDDHLSSVLLVLDFAAERLDFEIFHHLATEDDGTVAGATCQLHKLRFVDAYLMNGKLEVWGNGRRLSRKDAFIPLNLDLGTTHKNYEAMISAAEKELSQRSGG